MSTPEKQEQKEQAPSRLPFVLHALGFYLPDASTEEDSPSSEADPARPVAAPKDPDWDVSHLCTRSYKFQPLGEEDFASPPSNQDKKSSSEAVPAPKSSPASDSQSEAEEQDLPYLVEVPQLSSVQLNVVFPKFIRTVNFNGITEILIRKKNRKELEEWEYREWKDMINTLKKCPTFKNSDEKTAWKRAFLNGKLFPVPNFYY